MAASPVFLYSPLIVQKVHCVNLKLDRFEGVMRNIGNVTCSQQLCNVEINRVCYQIIYKSIILGSEKGGEILP